MKIRRLVDLSVIASRHPVDILAAMHPSAGSPRVAGLVCLLLALMSAQTSFAWGPDGHRMINRLALQALPSNVPEFLRDKAATDEIEYLGPEPDRWRSRNESELNAAQAPEHYINLELADLVGALPRRRPDFVEALFAARITHPAFAQDLRPTRVGLQPWVTNEVYERLQAALREYREQKAKGQDTRPVEAAAIFYVGWLGHYVGDGSMPLHTSIHANGWMGQENPHGYVTSPGIHAQFESAFVHRNIKAADIAPLMTGVKPLEDPFEDYVAYLRISHTLVQQVYEFEKVGGFNGRGSAQSRYFTADRLAAGASELRDMIVTAWLQSAKPAPVYHEPPPVPRSTRPAAATNSSSAPSH